MSERRGSPSTDTDRPEDVAHRSGVLPTARDVLRMPVMVQGRPEVLAAAESLDRPVRWVHVSDSMGAPDLLDGGELLLSTGAGWADDHDTLAAFVGRLASVPIAGLVLELGARFVTAPPTLVAACRFHGIPLIVLHRVVKFVAVTEAVHGRIIHEQTEALRVRDRLHDLFIGLSLRGSTPDYIVSQLAKVLRAPVVLEDLSHRVVAVETLDADDEVLVGWESTSRSPQADWSVVPVEARGLRWGYLIALPGEPHTAGREQVMQQAAVALAIGRLADGDADEWTRRGQEQLLGDLLGARFASSAAVTARFEAAGLPIAGRGLIGVAVASATTDLPARLRAFAAELGGPAIVAASSAGVTIAAISLPASTLLTDAVVDRAARGLAAGVPEAVVALGAVAQDVAGLLGSIQEAGELLRSSASERGSGIRVLRVQRRPLLRLVTAFADDPRLQAHSERMLRPLIEYDLDHGGDLLEVLRAYVSFPGNRTKAASAGHLSRSVFYQRIALIEDLLDVDLDDGETVSALHAALLARRG